MSGHRVNDREMHKLRGDFYKQGKQLDAAGDPEANCWIDGEPIDYTAQPGSTEDSHNLDHYYPVEDYPELQKDPTNFRHAHRRCNGARGKRDATTILGLGEPVPDWW